MSAMSLIRIILLLPAILQVLPSSAGFEIREGGIIRGPRTARQIALLFTGHEFAEGGEAVLTELQRHRARASFFLTGSFLRTTAFRELVRKLIAAGHYIGPHSDKHLLYCSWEADRKTLVTRAQFRRDLEDNLRELERFGVARDRTRFWVPAYEWYNPEIAGWSAELGLQIVNMTPGTRAAADYTGEAEKNFVSSEEIMQSILKKEKEHPDGLNGFLLLMHIGAGPGRKDKMHDRLGELLNILDARGRRFVRVDELLAR